MRSGGGTVIVAIDDGGGVAIGGLRDGE